MIILLVILVITVAIVHGLYFSSCKFVKKLNIMNNIKLQHGIRATFLKEDYCTGIDLLQQFAVPFLQFVVLLHCNLGKGFCTLPTTMVNRILVEDRLGETTNFSAWKSRLLITLEESDLMK
jgi:hypothetical protein